MMYPHEWFATLYSEHQNVFKKILLGGSNTSCEDFWRSVSDWPAYKYHSVASFSADELKMTVPLALHGDGSPTIGVGKSWAMSTDNWSLTSLLAVGPTLTHYHTMGIIWCEGQTTQTTEAFLRHLSWSLHWLQQEIWPRLSVDRRPFPPGSLDAERAGSPLAAGYRGSLLCLFGDLEHYASKLRLEHYASNQPCIWCRAGRLGDANMQWTSCRRDSAWWATVYGTPDEWKRHHFGRCLEVHQLRDVCLSPVPRQLVHTPASVHPSQPFNYSGFFKFVFYARNAGLVTRKAHRV